MMQNVPASVPFALGIIGNITSFFLFLSPVPTFYKIFKAKSVGNFSGIPYAITLLNCALWIFYGLPSVSNQILVTSINSVGFGLEVIYIIIHLIYGTKETRKKVIILTIAIAVAFVAFACGALFGAHNLSARKSIVGAICLAVSIIMYGSPLTIMWDVIKTKSTKYMPFFLSLSCFINGALWGIYGILMIDVFIAVPNGVGAILAAFQLGLYGIYYKSPTTKTIDENEKGNGVCLVVTLYAVLYAHNAAYSFVSQSVRLAFTILVSVVLMTLLVLSACPLA